VIFKRPSSFRGGGLFGDAAPETKGAGAPAHRANIDGGSRGNPGPAAYGVVIQDARGQVVARLKKYIGRATNNVAESYGLIAALDYAESHGIRALRVESDSELLVKQMRGQYKVKSADLRPLFERARKMSQRLESFRIEHVYREQNAQADALANEALDETAGGAGNSPGRSSAASNQSAVTRESKGESRRVRARYRNGALYPVERLNLPDNTEVEVLIKPIRRD
jgi:ribonuclease HI